MNYSNKGIYKCKCGAMQTIVPTAVPCMTCGTPLEYYPDDTTNEFIGGKKSKGLYSPTMGNIYSSLFTDCDINISKKYEDEISKISETIAKYKDIIDDKVRVMMKEMDKELYPLRSTITLLIDRRAKLRKKYNESCRNALTTNDFSIASELSISIKEVDDLISANSSNIVDIADKHRSKINIAISTCDESKIVRQLFRMRDDYVQRIQNDRTSFAEYIIAAYKMECGESSWCEQFFELAEEITNEEDEYLCDICDEYKGKKHYMRIAKRLHEAAAREKALYEMSKAEVISGYRYDCGDLDPYSRRASRMCFESYVSDVIARLDESITGFKI